MSDQREGRRPVFRLRVFENDAGRRFLALHDADGKMLPQQVSVELRQSYDELGRVTVTFNVDGEDIVMDPHG
jgi:hypothetical protein